MSEVIYFEDMAVGNGIEFGPLTIGREEIIAFAREFDPQPLHLSDEGAAATHFGTLSSSGWHTKALSMKMMLAAWETKTGPRPAALGGLGGEGLRLTKPMQAGEPRGGKWKVMEKIGGKGGRERGRQ